MLDLQVIRPDPVVELEGEPLVVLDGSQLFVYADAATAGVDELVREGLLADEAADDHDVREHFDSGAELVKRLAEAKRQIPRSEIPGLRRLGGGLAIRERCRLRRLRRAG